MVSFPQRFFGSWPMQHPATARPPGRTGRSSAPSPRSTLAQYGDVASRWSLVQKCHQSRLVRKAVSPAEITRYALELMVSKPEGVDSAAFEFIFNTTQITRDGRDRDSPMPFCQRFATTQGSSVRWFSAA